MALGISVIIPAFNSAATLRRAIDSALTQTIPPKEILVVDDCSTDATAEIVKGYPDATIRLISNSRQRGAGGARNVGIGAATCELIAFLDSDDEWLPTKLATQLEVLSSSPSSSLVACRCNLISPSGEDLGDIYKGHPIAVGRNAWKALLAYNFVATPSVIARRETLLALGGFDETLKVGEDQDLWIRLSLAGDLGYAPESLVRVHARENSLSAWLLSDVMNYTIPMIQKHLAAQKTRLSASEVRKILGERLGRLGRVAYSKGELRTGSHLIVRSILLGYRPLQGFLFLGGAAPPLTWLRRKFSTGRS